MQGLIRWAVVAATLSLGGAVVQAQQQGVGRSEVLVGTIQDLSGPVADRGKQAGNGMLLRVEELNAQGGLHGRRLRLLVEDNGYDPKRSVLAAHKLVNRDKVFLIAGHMGTAHNLAAMPVQFDKNVVNFMPITAAREMYEPLHKLKYAFAATYYDQIRTALPRLAAVSGARQICSLYQDDEFGLEVQRGTEAALAAMGMAQGERTSFKRGATDFSSQVARLKAAGCDLVVLGTLGRETIGTIAEARKTGFSPSFLGSVAVYSEQVPRLGGKSMDGLYATMTVLHPYLDEAAQPVRLWANKYRTRFDEDPTVFSVYGYSIIDQFIQAAQKAGPDLTTDSFVKAMDTMDFAPDMFGSAGGSYSPTKRLGSAASRLSQIQGGRWRVVSDYVK